MTSSPATQQVAALAGVLTAELEALEKVHYRVAQAAGLAAAGRHRFLAAAADDVLDAVDELASLELARGMLVADLAASWSLPTDQPTLRELVAAAPESWQPVLAGLDARARELVEAIDAAAARGEASLRRGLARVQRALAEAGGRGYEADGSPGGLVSSTPFGGVT